MNNIYIKKCTKKARLNYMTTPTNNLRAKLCTYMGKIGTGEAEKETMADQEYKVADCLHTGGMDG
jgi:hypothetical protein